MHTTRSLIPAGAIAAAAAAGLALSGPAQAKCPDEDPCPPPPKVHAVGTVNVADGWTLGVRAIPRSGARQIRQLADGAKALIVCQTRGSRVTGTYGTTRLWDRLKHGGYVSDAYVYTGSDGRVAPPC